MEKETTQQDDGLELLRKVIETNEKNIEECIELQNSQYNLLHVHRKSEITMQKVVETLEKTEEFSKAEDEKRRDFLGSIPYGIEINLSQKANEQLEHFEEKSKLVRFVFYGMIAAFVVAAATAIFNIIFAKQWYSESIKAKSELRQEILDEIQNDGKAIYNVKDYNQLERNTDIMNKWMQKNPKDGEKFLRFKDGYESR